MLEKAPLHFIILNLLAFTLSGVTVADDLDDILGPRPGPQDVDTSIHQAMTEYYKGLREGKNLSLQNMVDANNSSRDQFIKKRNKVIQERIQTLADDHSTTLKTGTGESIVKPSQQQVKEYLRKNPVPELEAAIAENSGNQNVSESLRFPDSGARGGSGTGKSGRPEWVLDGKDIPLEIRYPGKPKTEPSPTPKKSR